MDLSPEQLIEVKKQLIDQINSTFPEEKKQETLQQIESMDDEQLIGFLKQNNLIKDGEGPGQQSQCVFCSIVFGDLPCTKIDENEKAIAILELNPISEGHTMILPKKHITKQEDLDQETNELALKTKELLEKTFNPKEIQMFSKEVMGHFAIHLVPIYNNETMDSPRNQKTPEQLAEIKNKIDEVSGTQQESQEEEKVEVIEKQPREEINESNTWLPKKIP